MATARIVMNDWGERWRNILETARIVIGMLDGYVDDVRQESTSFRMGTRWNEDDKKFILDEDAKKEDWRMKYEMQETTNARMVSHKFHQW